MSQPDQKYESTENIGIADSGVTHVLLLGLAKFLQHFLDFAGDPVLGGTGDGLLIVQSGVDQAIVAGGHGGERCNQVSVVQLAVGARGLGEGVAQAHEKVLTLVHELVGDFNLQEERGGIDLIGGAGLLVLAGLAEIRAVAGTIEGHFALLPAALGTNTPVDSRAEALFLADFTDRAGQWRLSSPLWHPTVPVRYRRAEAVGTEADAKALERRVHLR